MTNPAAIAGKFEAKKHAYRQTQDGVVVSFVIHPDDVNSAFAVAPLGTPFELKYTALDYDNPAPATEAQPVAKQTRKPWGELLPKTQAGMRCGEPEFQRWAMNEALNVGYGIGINSTDEQEAAIYVRKACGVTSRKDITPGSRAAEIWASIDQRFQDETRLPEQR